MAFLPNTHLGKLLQFTALGYLHRICIRATYTVSYCIMWYSIIPQYLFRSCYVWHHIYIRL